MIVFIKPHLDDIKEYLYNSYELTECPKLLFLDFME